MIAQPDPYPARLDIDYPEKLSRVKTLFRLVLAIPIMIISAMISGGNYSSTTTSVVNGELVFTTTSYAIAGAGGIVAATVLMLLFRKKYPRWWFDFLQELTRFSTRIAAYLSLMTDVYPSTDEAQTVHLDFDYPDAMEDLNRGLPLIKWLLAFPHYLVLFVLFLGGFFAIIVAWFAILITGRYPKGIFNYIEGVMRWAVRVQAYAFLMVTDKYPPFSMS